MKKFYTLVATAALIAQSAMPAVAASQFYITGNGSDSTSTTQFTNVNTTTVTQNNTTEVKNKVNVNANTGNNSASDNTGGNVAIETGDSDVKVNLKNMLNSNVADVKSCGSCLGDSKIVIDGNGTNSDNNAALTTVATTALFQNNVADVDNAVKVDAETGDNDADDNTGGDVTILTGDVDVQMSATTEANSNHAKLGGSTPSSAAGVEVMITGNGSYTDNTANLALVQSTSAVQDNLTRIRNRMEADADTGDNSGDDNTGGDVVIGTGDVDVMAKIMNDAGFNHFDAGDCCIEAVFAKIAENGTESENVVAGELVNSSEAFQTNDCGEGYCFDADLKLDGDSGENDADDNTGDSESDPVILTGDVDVEVMVENEGGSNVIGQPDPVNGLSLGNGLNVQISFDLGALLAYLGLE